MCKYSIIVPAYNEEQSLQLFYDAVIPVFEGLGESFEVIFVNDGSRDATKEIINRLAASDKRIKGCHFSRNFGQQAALLCALRKAQGEAVIAMDADLQDPPSVALEMIAKWKEGFDVVHGVRRERKNETFFKKFTAKMFYKITKKITGIQLVQNSGDFKLYDRKVVDAIVALSEKERVLRVQAAWVGFSQTCVEFDRPGRVAGETHYTMKKMINLAKAGIMPNTEYTLTFPIKLGIALGVLSLACFITFIVLACLKIPFGGLTAWLFPTVSCLAAIILVCQGVANMHTAMIFREVQNRPIYIVAEEVNFDK